MACNNSTPTLVEAESTIAYGSIELNTEITGTLYIDGEKIGKVKAYTKVPINEVKTGNRKLEIRGSETWNGSVTIYKNQTAKITATGKNKPYDLPTQFTDSRDGKVYKIVEIGDQVWMAENLAYKANSDCWAYNNDQSNVAKYGYLYNWKTANKVCPDGYHLPSDAEWTELTDYLGGENVAGEKLKSSSSWELCESKNYETNESGFSALPGGLRGSSLFYYVGEIGIWWSVTPDGSSDAWSPSLNCGDAEIVRDVSRKFGGCSVRCIRN